MSNFNNIQELLRKKADLQTRLSLIPYIGTPEIKENKSGKYLYIRKRELGKLTSQYVDKFSDELYQTLLISFLFLMKLRQPITMCFD